MSVTFLQTELETAGKELKIGDKAPSFNLIDKQLQEVKLEDYAGMRKLISIVPSIDTGVCDVQTRTFNTKAADLDNTILMTISFDLPFAQAKWCGAAGLENALMLSCHNSEKFAKDYGVLVTPLRLCNRAVIILDEQDNVIYAAYNKEMTDQVDFDSALKVLQ